MFRFIIAKLKYPVILLSILMIVAACSDNKTVMKFDAIDVTGADFGKDFKLRDPAGRVRTLADFRGKAVAIFFGYTHCPDVCPSTMSEMNQAMQLLGKDANRVQVLFVTVDPERDTPAVLASYVPAFNPAFLGLYGSIAETAEVAKNFKIFYQKVKSKDGKSYSMDHSAGTYVFDPAGNLRLFMKYGVGAQSIAHDLHILLN